MSGDLTLSSPLPARSALVLVALSTLLMAVSYLDRQVFAILAPTITSELAIDDKTYGLLAGMFSFAYLVAPPFAGLLLDTLGVRRALPLAVLVWSCVAAAHAGATGIMSLFMLRFALGLAESPSFPGAARVVRESVSVAASPRAFGFLFTGSSLGAIIAPPLATTLAASFGWRTTFVGTALVGLLWIPAWWLASSRDPARGVLDAARLGRPRAGEAATGANGSPSFVSALRQPAVWRSMTAVIAISPIVAFVLLWGSKLLVGRFGMTQKEVGALLWLPPLLFDVGAIVFGDLASRVRARVANPSVHLRVLFAIAVALCCALGAVAVAPDAKSAVWLAALAQAGAGGVSALQTSEVLTRVPRELVSVAAGVSAATQSLAYLVASALIGRIVGGPGGYDTAVIGLALWAVPGAILWVFWPARLEAGRPLRTV